MRTANLSIALFAATLLSSCMVVLPEPEPPGKVTPRHIAVLTPGLEIIAEKGDWTLTAGQPQKPPFVSTQSFVMGKSPLDHYDQALATGAQLVRVKVPQLERPLFGVLRLGGVFATTNDSSAKRVYRVQVPEKHVQAALGGQVSVVYQPYDFVHKVRRTDEYGDNYYADQKAQGASWILWLSDAPFPGQSAADPAPSTPATPDTGR